MKILFIKLGALGDVLMTTPAVHFIRMMHPTCTIHYVVNEEYACAIENNSDIARVITIPKVSGTGLKSKILRIISFSRTALKHTDEKYDIVFCMHLPKTLHILTRMWKAKKFYTLPQRKENWSLYHGLINTKTVAHGLGLEIPENFSMKLHYFSANSTSFFLPKKPYIILHPAGGINTGEIVTIKRWPLSHWISIGKLIQENLSFYSIVITGGKGEQPIADNIASEVSGTINTCGNTTLDELFNLQCNASLIISNDTGALHLAGATNTPILALFGPTDPVELAPRHNCTVLKTNLTCAPCYYGTFSGCSTGLKDCMESILPAQVFDAVLERTKSCI